MATWQESTPCEITIYDEDRWLNISNLEVNKKSEAWRQIRADAPDLAELLKSENFQMLVEIFGGEIEVERSALPNWDRTGDKT